MAQQYRSYRLFEDKDGQITGIFENNDETIVDNLKQFLKDVYGKDTTEERDEAHGDVLLVDSDLQPQERASNNEDFQSFGRTFIVYDYSDFAFRER